MKNFLTNAKISYIAAGIFTILAILVLIFGLQYKNKPLAPRVDSARVTSSPIDIGDNSASRSSQTNNAITTQPTPKKGEGCSESYVTAMHSSFSIYQSGMLDDLGVTMKDYKDIYKNAIVVGPSKQAIEQYNAMVQSINFTNNSGRRSASNTNSLLISSGCSADKLVLFKEYPLPPYPLAAITAPSILPSVLVCNENTKQSLTTEYNASLASENQKYQQNIDLLNDANAQGEFTSSAEYMSYYAAEKSRHGQALDALQFSYNQKLKNVNCSS